MILIDDTYVKSIFRQRKTDAHKGNFGRLLIFAGSLGMAGAAVLCGRAALRSGAGLVQFLLPYPEDPIYPILQTSVPEATCVFYRPEMDFSSYDSIAAGCGLGKSPERLAILEDIITRYGTVQNNFPTEQASAAALYDWQTRSWNNSPAEQASAAALYNRQTRFRNNSPAEQASAPFGLRDSDFLHKKTKTLVLDADALNLIAENEKLRELVLISKAGIIITPHVGEAKRLLKNAGLFVGSAGDIPPRERKNMNRLSLPPGGTTGNITSGTEYTMPQDSLSPGGSTGNNPPVTDWNKIESPAERQSAVIHLSELYNCTAVLKGANTLVCAKPDAFDDCIKTGHEASYHDTDCLPGHPAGGTAKNDSPLYMNTTGNPGMATAGSGDTLTGIIASLAGQGYSAPEAACMGVYFHGAAGDLAACCKGFSGMTAGDIAEFVPYVIKNRYEDIVFHQDHMKNRS